MRSAFGGARFTLPTLLLHLKLEEPLILYYLTGLTHGRWEKFRENAQKIVNLTVDGGMGGCLGRMTTVVGTVNLKDEVRFGVRWLALRALYSALGIGDNSIIPRQEC